MSANVELNDGYSELHVGNTAYKMRLPNMETDYIQGKIKSTGEPYELAMLKDMASRVQPGELILDVGANVGNHTLFMAMIAGSHVVAFEPSASLCEAVRESAAANGIEQRVSVRQCAVGAENGKGRFAQTPAENLGAQSVEVGEGEIEIIALDTLTFNAAVKLIKIDVEGMELDVLRGAANLLKNDRPQLYVECIDEAQFVGVGEFLASLGYGYWETFNATPTHLFVPDERVTLDERYARLSSVIGRGIYHTGRQLQETQRKLDEANKKYRQVTAQVAQYKSEVGGMTTEKQTLQADLAALKQRYESTSAEYQGTLEQVAGLTAQVSHNLATLETTRQELLDARSAALETQREFAVSERERAVSQALLTQTQANAAARLEDWQRWSEEQRTRSTAETTRLQEDLAATRRQFDDAQARYFAAVADSRAHELKASLLDGQFARVESERAHLQEQLISLNAKYVELLDRSSQLSTDLNDVQLSKLTTETQTAIERAQLATEIDQLREHSSGQATEIERLNTAIVALEAGLNGLGKRRNLELAELHAEREQQVNVIQQLHAEIEALRTDHDALQARLIAQVALREEELEQFERYKGQAQSAIDTLESAALAHAERIDVLTSNIQSLDEALAQRSMVIETLSAEIDDARAQASQMEAQHASGIVALNEKIHTLQTARSKQEAERLELNSTLSVLRSEGKADSANLERLKLEGVRAKVALNEANAQIERLRNQLVSANQQVLKTKNTLSFQLGHALIFGTKSWSGFFALPSKLWTVHQLSRQRRNEKQLKGKGAGSTRAAISNVSAVPRNANLEQVAQAARARLQGLHNENAQQLANRMKQLKVAAIMDEFTFGSYDPECNLLQLTPAHWQEELSAFNPDLLFIESAWRGKEDLWGNKVGHMSQEVVGIVQWCRDQKIPTVFWNKEDPVHFETFLTTAKLFDFVFTTDIDCIHRYKAALGHDRVYLLPFAAQPRVSNPVEKYERKDAFCFAGAYYARYPERTRDLGNFVINLPEYRPLEIYDRNYGKDDTNYQFPQEYQPFIVGNLPYAEIDKAYKGYKYAINLNSIKQSQTMFARRVYELLASNTITVSNFSRGVRLMFGDLVLTSDSGSEILRRLQTLGGDEVNVRKFRLAALRKVMSEHTYQDRLAYVVSKVGGEALPSLLPQIVVVAYAKDQAQADQVLQSFSRQQYREKALVLVVPEQFKPAGLPQGDAVRVLSAGESDTVTLLSLGSSGAWLSVMVADDHYGEHYLTDLALATRYSEALAIGKGAQYVWSGSKGLSLVDATCAYKQVRGIPARAGIARVDTLPAVTLRAWMRELYTVQFEGESGFAIDEFNYCRSGAGLDAAGVAIVDDAFDGDEGFSLAEILKRAEAIESEKVDSAALPQLRGGELASLLAKAPANSRVSMIERSGCLEIESALPDGSHEYWYAGRDFAPADFSTDNGHLRFHLETSPGLNIQLIVLFLDEAKGRLGHVIKASNRNHDVELPPNAAWLRIGLRIYASGSARVQSLLLGHRSLQPADMFAQGQHLVLTNNYPAYDDLYRNGFVHSRVRAYRERGVRCDVFRFRAEQMAEYHEFENTDVMSGGADVLERLLQTGKYRSVLVHFLDEAMWSVLKRYTGQVKVTIWLHGADIQSFERRAFMYDDDVARAAAKAKSEQRTAFWREVLGSMPASMHLVFVSQYLVDSVMADLGIQLPAHAYSVIHNPIDTKRFSYVSKAPQQRFNVLSIRPYASSVYANDLSVKAVLELSKKPFFSDMKFLFVGDGKLFDETLAPLVQFKNVEIQKRFLAQAEISELHKAYGIFLCPSRMDTQGVSRDEAMASGLVPVTNAVAAIPEFADGECAILAEAENALELSAGIETLVNSSDEFVRLSAGAAQRVRRQSALDNVLDKELGVIGR
jgi:FkbM family methyltransferase